MKIQTCGLVALERIQSVSKLSAYSLIQMAKDNDCRLLIYKVDPKELLSVPRPAILHAKDHFVYIDNGKALPEGEYSGYVLSVKGHKGARIVPHAEAKQVVGSKKGGVLRQIVPAALALIPGVGPILAGASAAGMDQYAKSVHPEQLGEAGNLLDIAKTAGTAFIGASGAQGAIQGFQAAAPGLGNKAIGLATGAAQGALHPIATNPLLNGSNAAGGASSLASNAGYNPGGVLQNNFNVQGGATGFAPNTPVAGNAVSSIAKAAPSVTNPAGAGGFDIKNLGSFASNLFAPQGQPGKESLLGNPLISGGAAAIASQFGKPDTSYLDRGVQGVAGDYSALKKSLGDSPLPAATEQELLKYVHTPIEDLANENNYTNDTTIRQVNQAYDRQVDNAKRQFAGAGQNYANSSDAQEAIRKIEDDRNIHLREANMELRNQNLSKAIQTKQFALGESIKQNQFDSNTAFELAKVAGQEQELKMSIETQDYNSFQNIIANILHMGYANAHTPSMNSNALA